MRFFIENKKKRLLNLKLQILQIWKGLNRIGPRVGLCVEYIVFISSSRKEPGAI